LHKFDIAGLTIIGNPNNLTVWEQSHEGSPIEEERQCVQSFDSPTSPGVSLGCGRIRNELGDSPLNLFLLKWRQVDWVESFHRQAILAALRLPACSAGQAE
jgi:hypothetical protein